MISAKFSMDLDNDFFQCSLHQPGTLVISTSGPQASKASYRLIASVLTGPCGVAVKDISSIYRFENPFKWYATLSEDGQRQHYTSLHGKQLEWANPKLSMLIEHHDKQRMKATLHWVPPNTKPGSVKKMAQSVTGDEQAEIFKSPDASDKWVVMCKPTDKLPHFIYLNICGSEKSEHKIMLTVPGRRIACPTCGGTDHWPNQCLGRPHGKSANKPVTKTVNKPLTENHKTPAPPTGNTAGTDAEGFQMVTNKRKRRNSAPSSTTAEPNNASPKTPPPKQNRSNFPTLAEAYITVQRTPDKNTSVTHKQQESTPCRQRQPLLDTPTAWKTPPQRSPFDSPPRLRIDFQGADEKS